MLNVWFVFLLVVLFWHQLAVFGNYSFLRVYHRELAHLETILVHIARS